ncbi:MAG TPA: rhomboid family intramembrane serine protease [Anaerolineae bacterium]|nr:rhomboid family intramembrane serine protease [Anaerolineae bacterium]
MLNSFQLLLTQIVQAAVTMGSIVIVLWIIHFVDTWLMQGGLKQRFGIQPRTSFNPLNFLIAPLLHVNFAHLIGNSVPLFVLGALVLVQGQLTFWLTTLFVMLVAGISTWFLGKPNSLHVGASGVILGYFGYILANVFFRPDLATILVATVVVVLYIGLIWQILPRKGVSFTGHLFGFLGGILAAWVAFLFLR